MHLSTVLILHLLTLPDIYTDKAGLEVGVSTCDLHAQS